jgi:hypothetical protein
MQYDSMEALRAEMYERAKESATVRAARDGGVYYIIEVGGEYLAVSARDYYIRYQGAYEALYRVEFE